MTDEKSNPAPSKLIEGSVNANAGPSGVAVNEDTRFCVSELVHHRYDCDPTTGKERGRISMIEFLVTQGTPPTKWSRFQGIGMLTADTPAPPQGWGRQQREYRFNIYSESVEEAWSKFEEFNKRGAKQAEDSFRREFAEWQKLQASRLAVVGGGGRGLLDAAGNPPG